MDISKNDLRRMAAYLIAVLFAGVLNTVNTVPPQWNILHLGVVSSIILNCVYLQWGVSARRRFPQKQMRSNVTLFTASLILLTVLRITKYAFTVKGTPAERYLWYAYYIPFMFGPTFMALASLCFGKSDNDKISKKWNWLFLPPGLIAVGILTNDLHQAAFRFPNGIGAWETDYTRGPIFFLAAGWIILMVLAFTVLAVRSTLSRRLLRTAWLPCLIAAFIALYLFLYATVDPEKNLLKQFFNVSDFICISSIALLESFVIARVIVSNKDYPAIFAASSLNAGLADNELGVRQVSSNGARPQPDQLAAALNGEILLPDGDTLLKARPVQGGWFYWTENIAELRRLREALEDTADYLNEENAMMRLASEIDEGRRATAQQTQLYDCVTQSLRPQLDRMNALLNDLPSDEEGFHKTLKLIGVLLAYAKRRSFLLLEANKTQVFSKEELPLCFEESIRALRLADVKCEYAAAPGVAVSTQNAVAMYEAFEAVIELALPVLTELKLTLMQSDGGPAELDLTLKISAGTPTETDLTQAFESEQKDLSDEAVRFNMNVETTQGGGA